MYTKQEASKIRQEFWTTFGRYMSPVLPADGDKVNWINYKTGEPHIAFKMDADSKTATIAIVFQHPDEDVRSLYYEQLLQLNNMLPVDVAFPWIFESGSDMEPRTAINRVYRQLDNVQVLDRKDWPALISFLKSGIIALDEFWAMARYAFEALR